MSSSIDMPGGLVDAGPVPKSLDRPAGAGGIDAAAVANAHGTCANCGAALHGDYCGTCGQKAHVHRSLLHVGEEFVHGITHFDGKAWKTLPMLLFRPGRLTRDYIMGQRARYIAPVPLFLLVVFLMFFVFSFVRLPASVGATDAAGNQLTSAQAQAALAGFDTELAGLDKQIAAARASGDTTGLAALRGTRAGVATARGQVKARAEGTTTGGDGLADYMRSLAASDDFVVIKGVEPLNAKVRTALKNPDLILYKIQGKAYKLSFLLVPMSLPWLWLMFAWKRGVRMYDHAIFALYSISFMSLLFVTGSIALTIGGAPDLFWFGLIWVAPVAHMYVQLKGAYALSRFGAAWRTVGLITGAIFTLSFYAVLMVALGVLD